MGRIYKVGDFIEVEELDDNTKNEDNNVITIDSTQFKGQELKYYQNNLQGKTVQNKAIGKIFLGKKGKHETSFRAPKKYLAVLCFIDKLIETGNCNGKMEQPKHPRNDAFVGFYIIYNKAIYDGKEINIKITIGVDNRGNKYYVFNAKPINEDLSGLPAAWVEPTNQGEQVHDLIINDKQKNVNLSIKDLNEMLQKYIKE